MFCCVFGMIGLSWTIFVPLLHLITIPILLLLGLTFVILLCVGSKPVQVNVIHQTDDTRTFY